MGYTERGCQNHQGGEDPDSCPEQGKALPGAVRDLMPHLLLASSFLPDMDPLETRLLLINEHPG